MWKRWTKKNCDGRMWSEQGKSLPAGRQVRVGVRGKKRQKPEICVVFNVYCPPLERACPDGLYRED